MKEKLSYLLCCISLLIFQPGFSQEPKVGKHLENDITNGLSLIYHFQFEAAEKFIKAAKSAYPNEPTVYLLHANYYWWLIISGEDSKETRNQYFAELLVAEKLLKLTDATFKNNESKYNLINIYAFKARVEGLNKNYLKVFGYVDDCIDALKLTFGKEEEYANYNLTSGLYNYYISSADKNYPLLIPYLLFLPDGDRNKGLNMLKQAASSDNVILSTEATYFLMKIYMEEKNPTQALHFLKTLNNIYPENLLFVYYTFKNNLKKGDKQEAVKQMNFLKSQIKQNSQLSANQSVHFVNLMDKSLKEYELKEAKKKL